MVSFSPIGKVSIEKGRYYLDIDKAVFPAVSGLDEYGHIMVVWWFNLYDNEETRKYLVMDKPYTNGPEKIGVLATRGPVRPNPIAVTVCNLVAMDQSNQRIEVAYLDAENDTPILDLKPYHPSSDRVRDIKMPEWCCHWPNWYENSQAFDWSKEFNFPD
jgi:tRNA (adenine37-N6)-methyltransferase